MAVDTQNKRRSAPDFFPFVIMPVPDGTIGAADRQQATGLYSSTAAYVPTVRSSIFGGLVVR